MTASDHTTKRALTLVARKRSSRLVATATVIGLATTAIMTSGGPAAGAATLPEAQSVGNFLDATLAGNTLDAIASLKYASAVAPGSQSVQNPLDATVLGAATVPLTGALQLPQVGGVTLGAVNQVAVAHTDGSSYGASGAVSNSGGVSVGGNNSTYPADAKIDLSADALSANAPVAIPGQDSAAALGSVTADIGAVSAIAKTPVGYGTDGSTSYKIASLDLTIGSPLLSALLSQLTSALNPASVTSTLAGLLPSPLTLTTIAPDCALTSGTIPPLNLEDGAVTIATSGSDAGTITIDLEALLTKLGLDLNALPANTDLTAYLLAYLADPNGLATGIEGLISDVTDALKSQFTACAAALNAIPSAGVVGLAIAPVLAQLIGALTGGQTTLTSAINNLLGTVGGASGTANPLAPLASALAQLIDIGVNVQPNGAAGPTGAAYSDPLDKTPKQGTPVVADQTIVRAIEVNVAAASNAGLPGLPSLPGLGALPGLGSLPGVDSIPIPSGLQNAGSGATGILSLALANAAAGPSTAPTSSTPSSSTPASAAATTAIPTGVPAGAGTHGGSPVLPLVLLLVCLTAVGGGIVSYRMRGRFTH